MWRSFVKWWCITLVIVTLPGIIRHRGWMSIPVETTANTESDYEWSLPDAAFFFTVDHSFKPIIDRPDDSCTEMQSRAV